MDGIIFTAAAVAGLIYGSWRIERQRAPYPYDGILFAWTEKRGWTWLADRVSVLFILIHSATVFALSLLAVLSSKPDAISKSAWIIEVALGLQCGVILALLVVSRWLRPFSMSIGESGIARGQFGSTWDMYSHYKVNAGRIRLYSSTSPDLVRVQWLPADPGAVGSIVALLEQHLPDQPGRLSHRWYYRKVVFFTLLLLITVPFLAVGLVVYSLLPSWSFVYAAGAAVMVILLGPLLIREFGVD
jgi:hypothetical protein